MPGPLSLRRAAPSATQPPMFGCGPILASAMTHGVPAVLYFHLRLTHAIAPLRIRQEWDFSQGGGAIATGGLRDGRAVPLVTVTKCLFEFCSSLNVRLRVIQR